MDCQDHFVYIERWVSKMKTTACSFKELYFKWSLHYIRLFCSHAEHPLRFPSFARSQIDRHAGVLLGPAEAAGTAESASLVNKQSEAAASLCWASKL